jgi:hypothetical protein
MKGKIAIVLFSLALVFGMIAVSCDNGDFPDRDTKDSASYVDVYEEDTTQPLGYNLPVISLNTNQPIRATDVAKKLTEKKLVSGAYVAKYSIATVAYDPTKHGASTAAGTLGEIATKYAGLSILVEAR